MLNAADPTSVMLVAASDILHPASDILHPNICIRHPERLPAARSS
jgi:hypothetical protein